MLQLRLCPLLRRTGVMQRRSVSSFCLRSCALPWGDSVAELIVQLLSARVGKTRTGSLEHSGPVWQSERNFQASTASALGLCAASSVARMESSADLIAELEAILPELRRRLDDYLERGAHDIIAADEGFNFAGQIQPLLSELAEHAVRTREQLLDLRRARS